MPGAPSTSLAGPARPFWVPAHVPGNPFGALICAICPGDVPANVLSNLLPAERQFADNLRPPSRRSEWVAGRLCLAHALARFCTTRAPILPEPSGAPAVPEGLCGSISHKGPFVLALASSLPGGVGVDVECVEGSDERIARKVLTDRERLTLGERDAFSAALFVTMHFAMKEAIYKAMNAAEQRKIDFDGIELQFPEMIPRTWLEVVATIHDSPTTIRAAVLQDEEWIIATARRA